MALRCRRVGAVHSIKTGSHSRASSCPLYPDDLTPSARPVMSAKCHEETSHLLNDSAERPTGPTRMRVIEARRFLSGGLITFDDGLRLLQGRHKFRPGHQCSGLAGLDCATGRNRYGDGSHALDVRHVLRVLAMILLLFPFIRSASTSICRARRAGGGEQSPVTSGSRSARVTCPLYPQQQTSRARPVMSAKGHEPTSLQSSSDTCQAP